MSLNDVHPLAPPLVTGGIAILIAAWGFLRDRSKGYIKAMEKKVDKEDCSPAMNRVGKQLDKCEARLDKHDESLAQLKAGTAFLVGRAGGNPKEMGLM